MLEFSMQWLAHKKFMKKFIYLYAYKQMNFLINNKKQICLKYANIMNVYIFTCYFALNYHAKLMYCK